MSKKYISIPLCFITALSLVSCSPKQKEFEEEVDSFVKNYTEAISTEDSLSKDLALKGASGDLRKISEYYEDAKNKDTYEDILSNNITTEMFDLIYEYCLDDNYEIQPDLLDFYKYKARNNNSSSKDEQNKTATNKTQDIPEEISIPDLPEDFIDCQKYIGQDINILGINSEELDHSVFIYEVGSGTLYGNRGTISAQLGWDDKTITNMTLRLDDGEYIQGDEYEEISSKLEDIFGEAEIVSDGITNYAGNTNCTFRLLRNGAGIGWNEESMNEFEKNKPSEGNESKDTYEEPKYNPKIGMSADEVKNSKWGEPSDINKTTTQYSTSEQWVYKYGDGYRYIYFTDGVVTGIQE